MQHLMPQARLALEDGRAWRGFGHIGETGMRRASTMPVNVDVIEPLSQVPGLLGLPTHWVASVTSKHS